LEKELRQLKESIVLPREAIAAFEFAPPTNGNRTFEKVAPGPASAPSLSSQHAIPQVPMANALPSSSLDSSWTPAMSYSQASIGPLPSSSDTCSMSTGFGGVNATDEIKPTASVLTNISDMERGFYRLSPTRSTRWSRDTSFSGAESEKNWEHTPEIMALSPTFTNVGMPALIRMSSLPDGVFGFDMPPSFASQPSLQAWEMPIRLLPPTGPVDSLLIGLIQTQRSMAISGTVGKHLTGPYHPSIKSLLYPDQNVQSHPVSSVISNLLQNTLLSGLPEKAACFFIMYRLLQWQISLKKENYDNLPVWYIPRSSQILTPHPIWIDQIPWGKLRDKIINNQELYATDEFQQIYNASLNVNWPFQPVDVMAFVGDEVRVTEVFERHILRLENWSLDAPFAQRYPELRNDCRFTGFVQNMDGAGQNGSQGQGY
jgi:hypothetical protein